MEEMNPHILESGEGKPDYSAPALEILEIQVEEGFAQSAVTYDPYDNTENSGYDQTPETW